MREGVCLMFANQKGYNEYLRKINELNKIIDEKDKLIVKLLSKKR